MQRNGEVEQFLHDQGVENNETENNPVHEIPPRRKRAEIASIFAFAVTSALILCLTWYSRDEVKYVPVNIANGTYYKSHVETKYHGLFVYALTVFTVLVGAVVDRLTLVAEEIFHVESRYGGKYCKVWRACFSGLRWKKILFGIIFAVIIITIYFAKIKIEFKLDYLVLVFSGIGFGSFVQRLLKLDAQAEVHISTILEEKGKTVADVLAWAYYVSELKALLPQIQHAINNSSWNGRISSRKLILLLPLDGQTQPDNLPNVDQRLSEEDRIRCKNNPDLSVYVLGVNSGRTKKYFLFTFPSPLQAIFSMSESEKAIALPRNMRREEVVFCCKSLEKVINDPVDVECKDKCVVISYKQTENRTNNWLVKSILKTENDALATDSSKPAAVTEHEDQESTSTHLQQATVTQL